MTGPALDALDFDAQVRAHLASLPTLTAIYRAPGSPPRAVEFVGQHPGGTQFFVSIDPLCRISRAWYTAHPDPLEVTVWQGTPTAPTGLFTFALDTRTEEGAALYAELKALHL